MIFLFLRYQSNAAAINEEYTARKRLKLDPFADLRDNALIASAEAGQAMNPACVLPCEEELAKYKAIRVPNTLREKNPLQFWKENADEYPVMALTARRILCISASSAQSERDFLSVGHTITDVRSRLSPEKVEAIEIARWGLRAGLVE